MGEKLFGTSGIRRLSSAFTDDFIRRLAASLARSARDGRIAVGRDTRPSSPLLSETFISALAEAGRDVVDLGIATTPTVAMASEEYGTGVVITASHNPPEYNGFKFWSGGRAYSPEQERALEDLFDSMVEQPPAKKPGRVEKRDYVPLHIQRILDHVGKVKKPVKVLLDCANGAGSLITPQLLSKMGCDVVSINASIDGVFAHGLEPTAENLKETCLRVKEVGADVGIVHDGDADRSAAIGRDGKLVDWDSFLAVLAAGSGKAVTTVDASMRIEEVCSSVVRTPIGDVAVADAVCRLQADFGGEPSGSMIFPEVHMFPDGPLTAAKIVKLVSEDRFYEVIEGLKKYPVERVKVFYAPGVRPSEAMGKIKPRLIESFKGESVGVNEIDGIRTELDGGWFLVRPSGTEPCIRITAEAESEEKLSEFVKRCKECIESCLDVA